MIMLSSIASMAMFCVLMARSIQPADGFVNHNYDHTSRTSKIFALEFVRKKQAASKSGLSSRPTSLCASSSSTTNTKPLYDGTNYTFPDTTTTSGIAELLEVSFVHSCMELRTGHVDVLKCFVATCMAGYEFGYTIPEIEQSLENDVTTQTANRPLLPEETNLRSVWISLVYLTLSRAQHPIKRQTKGKGEEMYQLIADSIPESVRNNYGSLVDHVAKAYLSSCGDDDDGTQGIILSMDELRSLDDATEGLTDADRAIRMQSSRIIPLSLQVRREAAEAAENESPPPPPTPPIEGAF